MEGLRGGKGTRFSDFLEGFPMSFVFQETCCDFNLVVMGSVQPSRQHHFMFKVWDYSI